MKRTNSSASLAIAMAIRANAVMRRNWTGLASAWTSMAASQVVVDA